MALSVGTNSWITVDEADDYLADKMNASDWFDIVVTGKKGSVTKESILITAFNEIKASPLVDVDTLSTDERVKSAQAEMALFLLQFYDELFGRRAAIASGLSSFIYSEREENFNSRDGGGSPGLPSNVLGFLNDYSQANTTVDLQV